MRNRYIISPQAKDDLYKTWKYTLHNWGDKQADNYKLKILKCCEWLTDNPSIGKQRNEFSENFYSFPIERHLIFYQPYKEGIAVLAITHQSEDVDGKKFEESDILLLAT